MAISFYDLSVPVFIRGLGQLAHVLDKGVAHAKETGVDPQGWIGARLAPDMLTLAQQVQVASDSAKLGIARTTGIAAPSFPDDETTIEQLQARIAKTIDHLKSFERAQLDGIEDRRFTVKLRGHEIEFKAIDYLLQFSLPNFFFHITTAYDILRHNGVPVGKMDYLGTF